MKTLLVCINQRFGYNSVSCAGGGGKELLQQLQDEIASRGLRVGVETIACFGKCKDGPNIRLAPGGRFWHHVQAEDIRDILDQVTRE